LPATDRFPTAYRTSRWRGPRVRHRTDCRWRGGPLWSGCASTSAPSNRAGSSRSKGYGPGPSARSARQRRRSSAKCSPTPPQGPRLPRDGELHVQLAILPGIVCEAVGKERGVSIGVPFPLLGGDFQVAVEHGVAERLLERDADPDHIRLVAQTDADDDALNVAD